MVGRAIEVDEGANEQIEAILGRFQKWNAGKGEAMPRGVRELSYEEALASSRSRWSQHTQAESAPAPPQEQQDSLRAEPGVVPVAAPPAEPQLPRTNARIASGKPHAAGARAETSPGGEARGEGHMEPDAATAAFRAVMSETVRPRGAMVAKPARGTQDGERLSSVSVRMTASEQALIRLRAAAAGTSVSGYLRQCAIEVEVLRAQVDQLMAAATRSRLAELAALAPPAVQNPAQQAAPREGWWTRLWTGRTRQLSLRA